jgi:hypothetical protein
MGARMLAALGALVALGAALAEIHRRDMRRIALTDAAMDGFNAGKEYGARTEAARIAAEREAEDDARDAAMAPVGLEIEQLERGPEGLRVVGRLPAGPLADAMAADLLSGMAISPDEVWTPAAVQDAVDRFLAGLEHRRTDGPPAYGWATSGPGAAEPGAEDGEDR